METFFKNITAEEGTKEKLSQDLMTLIHDAEDLVKATSGTLANKSKEELLTALGKLKITCRRVEAQAVAGGRATARIVREYPYPSIGFAFGLGLLMGVLAVRR